MCDYKFRSSENCEEEALKGSQYCILHIGLPEDEESEEFDRLAGLKEEEVKEKAQNGDFNFEGAILLKVEFANKEISDEVNFRNATIRRDVVYHNAKIGGDAWFTGAKIGGDALFAGAKIGGSARFAGAKIGRNARFAGTKIGGDASFTGAKIGGNALFAGADDRWICFVCWS